MSHFSKKSVNLNIKPIALAISLAIPSTALAQPGPKPVLEEITVTAQKRTESLQDVPLSVATLSGEKIAESGVENLQDLTVHMPNIHFTETGIGTQVRVRGIGSDNSQGFEQSVGMYIDGVYHGRAQLFRLPLFDLERAELLRGPQSTLFGKNSIAGALNLTSARPTDEFEAELDLGYSEDHGEFEINHVLSVPIAENLYARLALRYYETDGHIENTYTHAHEPESEEIAGRLTLAWEATENLDFTLKAEQNNFDWKGRAIEIIYDEAITDPELPGSQRNLYNAFSGTPLSALYGLDAPGNFNESVQAVTPIFQAMRVINPGVTFGEFEDSLDYKRQADFLDTSNNEVTNITLTTNYDFSGHTLTAVTGFLDFSSDETCDCDYTPVNILSLNLDEEYKQFSQEIRIASPTGGAVEWLAGVFYQDWDQEFSDYLELRHSDEDPNFLTSIVQFNAALRGSNVDIHNTGTLREFEQTSESWAIFARTTFHIADILHITLGARFTEEEKTGKKSINLIEDIATGEFVDPTTSATGLYYMNLFGVENEQIPSPPIAPFPIAYGGQNVQGERTESEFLPLINVELDITENSMLYGSYTKGFKAGGFDPRSNTVGEYDKRIIDNDFTYVPPAEEANPLSNFEFEDEQADAYEVGIKNTIADGRGELNVALYRTEYDNLQFSQFDGGVGFNVGNIKETLVQGVELEGRWLLIEDLTAHYSLAYLDFEYKDFENANCHAMQLPNDDGFCSLTGERGVFTPELTVNTSFDYRTLVGNNLEFISVLDLQYVSEQKTHVNHDPIGEIDSYTLVGARIGIEGEHWGIALVGKNLTDEKVVTYSGNAPLSDSTLGTNTHYAFVKDSRSIAIETKLRF